MRILVSSSCLLSRCVMRSRKTYHEAGASGEKGPAARQRPKVAREAYFLYVDRATEGANAADGPLSALAHRRNEWSDVGSVEPVSRSPLSDSAVATSAGSWCAGHRRSKSGPSPARSSSASTTSTPRHRTETASLSSISAAC